MNLMLTLRTERQELYKAYCHYKEDEFPTPKINFILVNDDQEELSESILDMGECISKEKLRILEIIVPNSILYQLISKFFFIKISYGTTTKLSSLHYIPREENCTNLPIFELYNIHNIILLLSSSEEHKTRFTEFFKKMESVKDESLEIVNWYKQFGDLILPLISNN